MFLSSFLGFSGIVLSNLNAPPLFSSTFVSIGLIAFGKNLSIVIMSIGIIVPGVSSTIILMLMGVYSTYLSSVSYLYFPVLIPMGIGLIIGCLICMKTTKFLAVLTAIRYNQV